jgi:hypothetical protein
LVCSLLGSRSAASLNWTGSVSLILMRDIRSMSVTLHFNDIYARSRAGTILYADILCTVVHVLCTKAFKPLKHNYSLCVPSWVRRRIGGMETARMAP